MRSDLVDLERDFVQCRVECLKGAQKKCVVESYENARLLSVSSVQIEETDYWRKGYPNYIVVGNGCDPIFEEDGEDGTWNVVNLYFYREHSKCSK